MSFAFGSSYIGAAAAVVDRLGSVRVDSVRVYRGDRWCVWLSVNDHAEFVRVVAALDLVAEGPSRSFGMVAWSAEGTVSDADGTPVRVLVQCHLDENTEAACRFLEELGEA